MTTGKEKYTVEEAASMLAKETGERESELFSRLDAAVLSGDLPAYPRESQLKINYGAQSTYRRYMQPRGYQENVVWDDLNKWISENYRLLDYRFPNPSAAPVVTDDAPGGVEPAKAGLAFGIGGLGAAMLGWIADQTNTPTVYQLCSFIPLIGLLTALLPKLPSNKPK